MKTTVTRLLRGMLPRHRSGAPVPATGKRVWRISDSAPAGEWVDPQAPVATPRPRAEPAPREAHASGWLTSSMDLLGGAEIIEFPDSTAPDVPRDTP